MIYTPIIKQFRFLVSCMIAGIYVYAALGLIGCASSKKKEEPEIEEPPPLASQAPDISTLTFISDGKTRFTRQELIEADLLRESTTEYTHYRIIYPEESTNAQIKRAYDIFLQKLPEIEFFQSVSPDAQDPVPGVVHTIEIYPYTQAKRHNIYSLAVETQQGINTSEKTQRWHTLNLFYDSQSPIHYSTIFTEESLGAATRTILEFLRDDITRQKEERDIDTSTDIYIKLDLDFYRDLINTFTFIAFHEGFVGIRIYLSQFVIGREREGSYIVQVPSSVFYRYLKKEYQQLFIEQEQLPYFNDVHTIQSKVYPEFERL